MTRRERKYISWQRSNTREQKRRRMFWNPIAAQVLSVACSLYKYQQQKKSFTNGI